jgi:hypothetical protein
VAVNVDVVMAGVITTHHGHDDDQDHDDGHHRTPFTSGGPAG